MTRSSFPSQRTFVKNGPDGQRLERLVSSVAGEVSAKFDGFVEEFPAEPKKSTGAAPVASGGTTKPS